MSVGASADDVEALIRLVRRLQPEGAERPVAAGNGA
jgi:hypothetical protein